MLIQLVKIAFASVEPARLSSRSQMPITGHRYHEVECSPHSQTVVLKIKVKKAKLSLSLTN
jgi:hypothetical protein